MRAEPQILTRNVMVSPAEPTTTDRMVQAYDEYFRSGVYAARYPVANAHSLDIILEHGGREARHILDFGCGTGRYVVALLETSQAHVTGFDICPAAIQGLNDHLARNPKRERAEAILGTLDHLERRPPADVIICMFGVLSHIPGRRDRLETLARLGRLLTPGTGRLIVSVPNVYRRRVFEQLRRQVQITTGRDPTGGNHEPGDVTYMRNLGGRSVELFYHLYSTSRFAADLDEAGLDTVAMMPESVFSEAGVTHSGLLRAIDTALLTVCPTSLGYDLLAVTKARA